ncbi:alkylation response protein AidB-like acyl-CoA dehydrogenase [Dongia mobilis]|uniref:Medium-chain specific acyl-CoA dehydrogenase, mitochondrial n=1 Tax=Dongia mobilis TaxID=578943 RepID=A0A4R6WUW4_9PROT|nr:acyl-CoA dehydrogenase family protein [Dongia mobilis]TDQ84219.1 alkylation response protein AidB-like acyl-CoA dehydrogenase [Dongia mobilis]
MTLPLPPRAREIQARVRAFVDRDLIPWEVHAEMHDGLVPDEVWQQMKAGARDAGLYNMDIPESLGGRGYSLLEQAVAQEQIGRVTNGLGWCSNNPQRWMLEACSDYQIETWIKPIIADRKHECYAITEAEAGSDVDAIRSTARRDGDTYILNGEKWHVTSGNLADFMFFQAKIDGGPNAGAHALFFVDQGTPGIELVRTPAYAHNYRAHHPIYRFHDVRVPVANRIGEEGDGMDFTYAWFRYERLMIAARCCGAAERLIEEATAFAKARIVFGEPLIEKQAVQFMLADSATELFAARLMVHEVARAIDAGADLKTAHAQCSMAKLYASEMAGRVADRAVQIFGGRGYMRENVAERFFRELRVDRIWEGASEIQRLIIANGINKRGVRSMVE